MTDRSTTQDDERSNLQSAGRGRWFSKKGPGLALLLIVPFAYGIGVGALHWPPYSFLSWIKHSFSDQKPQTSLDKNGAEQLLSLAFCDPITNREQLFEPIESLQGIHDAVEQMMLPVERFWTVYSEMTLQPPRFIQLDGGTTHVMHVRYVVGDREYDAYAYSQPPQSLDVHQQAALIIPGSGENQSLGIWKRDPENYQHEILDLLSETHAAFVLIKPNQDQIAIHDGSAKLGRDFYANWLLDHGSSYGAFYVAGSLAITRALQERYDRVVIAGMSQGGEAALLNSLQSEPDAAIVASGYSAIYEQVKWSGANQIIIPGVSRLLESDRLRSAISRQRTQYLFSWGEQELATYGMDAQGRVTANALGEMRNVRYVTHPGGHAYPLDEIRNFLDSLNAKPRVASLNQ